MRGGGRARIDLAGSDAIEAIYNKINKIEQFIGNIEPTQIDVDELISRVRSNWHRGSFFETNNTLNPLPD